LRSEPAWLPVQVVIEINRRTVAATGEPFAIRDVGLLESAVARPRNHWEYNGEDDVLVLATVLMRGIACNQAFIQGNKRTGWYAMEFFLNINGYRTDLPDGEDLGRVIEQVMLGEISEKQFIDDMVAPHVSLFDQ
jgi:death on curing protein